MTPLRTRAVDAISRVDAAAWDALAGDNNPFVEHAFLALLEESRSVGAGTGWIPAHVLVEAPDGRLVGAAPTYVKEHSYGEYIFDWGWADAAQRAGLQYYPKIVCAVPFTPATGPRLLVAPGADAARVAVAVAEGARGLARRIGASSVHWLFTTESERDVLAALPDVHPRLTYQYHWDNDGYADFEQFLGTFRSRTRKEVRRERRHAAASGLTLETLRGPELDGDAWRSLYPLYLSTTRKKGAIPYLTPEFFALLPQRVSERVVVTLARDGRRVVAAALSFEKGSHLYGRYWGCLEEHEALHFELCYYRLLDHAIASRLTHVEAGAQGAHKIKRGFLPAPTYSAHWLRHPGLADAVARYLDAERDHHLDDMEALGERSPHRRGEAPVSPGE